MFRLIPDERRNAADTPYHLAATTTTAATPPVAVAAAARNNHRSAAADRGGEDGAENHGSMDESFFEAKPWLDSDGDDDFYSVRGDFSSSRGSTPDHQRRTQFFSGWIPVETPKPPPPPPPVAKTQRRLIDFLQEKQHYDDDDEDETASATDISGGLEDCTVHAQEHLKARPANKTGKANKKPSKPGCFPNSIWKHSLKMCRNSKTEQKPK